MALTRDELGKIVRDAWIKRCHELGDTKPDHLTPYDDLSEADKETDRQIGNAIYEAAIGDCQEWIDDNIKALERPIDLSKHRNEAQ